MLLAVVAAAAPLAAQGPDPAIGSSSQRIRFRNISAGSDAGAGIDASGESDSLLPSAPEPAEERPNAPWAAQEHAQPFQRVGIGADISPLGIGIKSATILTQYLDARLLGNFFNYNTDQFELEGFRVNADFHLASAGAAVDWYPLDSIWRLSVGTLLFNDNKITAASNIVPGTSFSLNGQTFYSASPNPAPGVTPLMGSGVVGFHTHQPALTLSGGFGKFVPRSSRHWSFPSEFGVAFIGAPTVNVKMAGWVCQDKAQTQCSNLSDTADPITTQFDNALQASLVKWRKGLSAVQVYPLFSYSVVYSFNVR